jgi:protein arginine N-methyltransferase 1
MDTYDLIDYADMIADRVRMDAYALALKAAIKPESVVLDIGTGPGMHALLAAKFGARKVYAIELEDTVHLARQVAQENGFGDRIAFYQDLSTNVTLPERVDVIVSDIRGSLPMYGPHIPTIIDARKRHLKEGGALIPYRDVMYATLVDSSRAYREVIRAWDRPYALSMEPIKQIVLNTWSDQVPYEIRKRHLLTEPQKWATWDYLTVNDPNVGNSSIVQEATRDGKAYGWLVWFDTDLTVEVGFSNGPDVDRISEVYGRGFFPLMEPVSVQEGDIINLSIHADLDGDEYEWRWHTCILEGNDSDAIKADFDQSTTIAKMSEDKLILPYISLEKPGIGTDGEIALYILQRMDDQTSIDSIGHQVNEAFSPRFSDRQEAIFFVHQIAKQFKP